MAISLRRAFALASASLFVASTMAQTATQALGATQTLGCYSVADPLTEFGDATFQTDGYCKVNCTELNPPAPVMAIVGGSTCYCGDELPPLDAEVSSDNCNSPCNGYPLQTCGGIGFWQVYLTGLTANVHHAPNSSSSSVSSTSTTGSTSSSGTAVVTKTAETVFVTNPASSNSAQKESSGGSSKVGIAVGVVVGVIALAAIIGVIVFIVKRKRNREIEEEHRRNAATSVSGKSDKSSTDQRLDPSIYSHRRQSIGSIADERDFSRRILQVRNPDRDSKSSAMA